MLQVRTPPLEEVGQDQHGPGYLLLGTDGRIRHEGTLDRRLALGFQKVAT